MFTKEYFVKWLKAAGIRAVKTMAETACAVISTSAILTEVDWLFVLSSAVLSGVITLLTCVKGLPEVDLVDDFEGEE